MGNAYLESKKKAMNDSYIIGRDYWIQMMCDIFSEILYDPTILGEKTLSPKDIMKTLVEADKRAVQYELALGNKVETDSDILRGRLDANMKQLVEDYNDQCKDDEGFTPLEFHPFEERYFGVEPTTYDKPIRVDTRHPATKKHGKRKKH